MYFDLNFIFIYIIYNLLFYYEELCKVEYAVLLTGLVFIFVNLNEVTGRKKITDIVICITGINCYRNMYKTVPLLTEYNF